VIQSERGDPRREGSRNDVGRVEGSSYSDFQDGRVDLKKEARAATGSVQHALEVAFWSGLVKEEEGQSLLSPT